MTSDELYTLFRDDVVDNIQPYLWSDAEIYAYMNDAYFMFVRMTGGISDYTSAATQVTAAQGVRTATADPSILFFRTASLLPDYEQIRIINAQNLETLTEEDYGVLRNLSSTTQGKPRYMVIGREPGLIEWYNIPDANYTVQLMIERLPTEVIEGANQEFAGVDAHHHFHFLKWMRHLAYRKQDTDAFDMARSDYERNEFVQYCTMAESEKQRYRSKVRVVTYGGI